MGTMTLLYLGGLFSIASKMNRLIGDVLSLRFDNRALSEEISRAPAGRGRLARQRSALATGAGRRQRWVLGLERGHRRRAVQPPRDRNARLSTRRDRAAHPQLGKASASRRPSLRQTTLDTHFAGETPRYQAEYRLRARAGDWRWILVRGKVTARDATGRPLWMAGTHTDVTDRHLIEEALCDTLIGVQRHDEQMTALNRMNDLLLVLRNPRGSLRNHRARRREAVRRLRGRLGDPRGHRVRAAGGGDLGRRSNLAHELPAARLLGLAAGGTV